MSASRYENRQDNSDSDDENDYMSGGESEAESEGEENLEEVPADEKTEKKRFLKQGWQEQWKEVMRLLASREVRWDGESGDPHVNILKDYKKEILKERDRREKTTPTILHILAKNLDADIKDVPDDILRKIIPYLLHHRESSSLATKAKDLEEDPILKVAMAFDNNQFINYVLTLAPGKLPGLLDARDAAQLNCLHYVFKVQLPETIRNVKGTRQKNQAGDKTALKSTLEMLKTFVEKAKDDTITATDKEGNTPVHYALNYELCSMKSGVKTYGKIVRRLILRSDQARKKKRVNEFNSKDESPYLYFLRTEREWSEKNKKEPRKKVTAKPPEIVTKSGVKDSKDIKEPEAIQKGNTDNAKMDLSQPLEKGTKTPGVIAPPEYFGASDFQPTHSTSQLQRREKPTTASRTRKLIPPQSHPSSHSNPPIAAEKVPGTAQANPILPGASNTPPEPSVRRKTHVDPVGAPAQSDVAAQQVLPPKSQIPEDEKLSNPSRSNANTKDPTGRAKEIRDFLKLHYIRKRSEMEAKELLYGKVASDKNLYFDAEHHRGESVGQVCELIEKLSASEFEDTLSYVNIPVVSHIQDKVSTSNQETKPHGANEGRQRDRGSQQENPCLGRRSLIDVFDKLRSVNVRNILRLHVEERDPDVPAHTDAAIERAIRGQERFRRDEIGKEAIKVELWDWRKPDLNIDVIGFAAPEVVNINLYWSGNATVLTAWACADGIPLLYRNSERELKKVILHASPGIESRERIIKMIEEFKKKIKAQTDDGVKVEDKLYIKGFTTGSKVDEDGQATAAGRSQDPPQHEWVRTMENFRRTLFSLHHLLDPNAMAPQRIKVALIDDGVDLSNLDTYNKVVKASGLSYCPPYGIMERPWHKSTNGHGTIMANMIVRINPWVSLDVMRIQDSTGYHPNGEVRTINAASAAKAIEGAILRQADIISMSWSIRNLTQTPSASSSGQNYEGGEHESAIHALQTAIDRAKEAKILMFCSAADDIKMMGKDFLPFSQAQNYIFRIGAALDKGQRDPVSEDPNSITYYFPGNQVAEAWNPRSAKTVQYHNGSSVSTALAAGFASLIMYINNVIRVRDKTIRKTDPQQDNSVFDEWARQLKHSQNMRRAFDNTNDPSHTDSKFLPVWHTFRKTDAQIGKAEKAEDKFSELENFVRSLCNRLERV